MCWQEPDGVQHTKVQSPAPGLWKNPRRKNPRHQYMLGDTNLERCFEENDLGVLLDMIQQCTLATKKASDIVGCIRHNISCGSMKVTLPLCSAWWGHIWSAVSTCGFPRTKVMWTQRKESREGLQRRWRNWSVLHVRKSWERWDCSALSKEGSGESHQCM